jgi:hypothetical protein
MRFNLEEIGCNGILVPRTREGSNVEVTDPIYVYEFSSSDNKGSYCIARNVKEAYEIAEVLARKIPPAKGNSYHTRHCSSYDESDDSCLLQGVLVGPKLVHYPNVPGQEVLSISEGAVSHINGETLSLYALSTPEKNQPSRRTIVLASGIENARFVAERIKDRFGLKKVPSVLGVSSTDLFSSQQSPIFNGLLVSPSFIYHQGHIDLPDCPQFNYL